MRGWVCDIAPISCDMGYSLSPRPWLEAGSEVRLRRRGDMSVLKSDVYGVSDNWADRTRKRLRFRGRPRGGQFSLDPSRRISTADDFGFGMTGSVGIRGWETRPS